MWQNFLIIIVLSTGTAQTFALNLFLKNCTKVEQQTYTESVYIKVPIYGQQTKQL
jgi:hypothetical protein